MPITKSAIKKMRQSETHKIRNYKTRRNLKDSMREVIDAVKGKDATKAKESLPKAYKTIDTAAKKNIIHPKNAAHKKSRLSKLVDGLTPKK